MSIPEKMTPLHVLAFLYLNFTQTTDEGLSEGEVSKIVDALQKWVPNVNREAIAKVMVEAASWGNSLADDDARDAAVDEYLALLGKEMQEKQRDAVILQLIELARADGTITAKEEAFISRVTDKLKASSAQAAT